MLGLQKSRTCDRRRWQISKCPCAAAACSAALCLSSALAGCSGCVRRLRQTRMLPVRAASVSASLLASLARAGGLADSSTFTMLSWFMAAAARRAALSCASAATPLASSVWQTARRPALAARTKAPCGPCRSTSQDLLWLMSQVLSLVFLLSPVAAGFPLRLRMRMTRSLGKDGSFAAG